MDSTLVSGGVALGKAIGKQIFILRNRVWERPLESVGLRCLEK